MKKIYDVVIVGAGIGGLTAAIYTVRAGKTTLVLESKTYGGAIINTLKISNYPALMDVSGPELAKRLYDQATSLGAEFEFAEALEVIDGEVKTIRTDDGDFIARTVILAMGTEPRKLSKSQAVDAGKRPISYCATCDGAFYKGKPVVVVGSGKSAKNEISSLEGIASKVYNIHHDDPIPKDAEAVFVAIGRVPNTKILKGVVDLDVDGYVISGEDCKTSAPGIFVVGDCRTKVVRQLITAAGDGAVAAGAAIEYLK